jgi:type IV pilus assembly protein PilY1
VGPVTAAPTVSADDTNHIWVFFGTGRFYGTNDKTNTDTQYFFGVKDPVVTGGCTQSSQTNCQKNNLLNVSSVTVCVVCATGTDQVSGITGVTTLLGTDTTTTLQGKIGSMDGWYTTLPTAGERDVSTPIIVGGTIFFPTFIPNNDICSASGNGMLYALFYQTGSAYKESVIGTEQVGSNTNVKRSMSLGVGLASQMAVHIGAQGSGTAGSGSGSGSAGRVTLIGQSSTGVVTQVSASPALASWSRYVSWMDQRN